MAPQSVSLPGIHELFPEHLMNTPPSSRIPSPPSNTHPDHARTSCSPHLRAPIPGQLLSGPSHSAGHGSSHRGTLPRASNSTSESHIAPPPRSSHSISTDHDHYQRNRPAFHPVPVSHLSRGQAGPERHAHPDHHPPSDRPDLWPVSHTASSSHALNDSESLTDDETPQAGAPSGVPRKHVCPICRKAFNRPSSLKIHYNTHTGATPFRCPWPRCGREFNVNSNMRRHLRNHNISSGQEVPDDGIRRRRRRSSAHSLQSPITTGQQSASGPRTVLQGNPSHHQAAPPQYSVPPHLSEASHRYMRYRVYDYPKDHKGGMDSDEAEEYPSASGDPHRHMRMPVSVTRGLQAPVIVPHGAPQRHSGLSVPQEDYHSHHRSHSGSSGRMHMRALTPGSSFHSSSPSPSPSPSLSPTSSSFNSPPPSTYASPAQSPALLPRQHQIQYSPSMPYLRGARDSHVSTALRPAFNGGGHTVGPRH